MLVVYRFEVLPFVKIRIAVFWIAMMRSLVVSTAVLVEPAVFFVEARLCRQSDVNVKCCFSFIR